MSGAALLLIVGAAAAHATWNLYAKRAAHGGLAFLWLTTAFGTLFYAPLGLWQIVATRPALGLVESVFIIGSVVLHTVYFRLLQRGYAVGDLSIVYPVARGVGPILALAGAIVVLGERPSAQAVAGGFVVSAAVCSLGVIGRMAAPARRAASASIGYALLTAAAIASYTLWDAHAVSTLAIPPLVFTWLSSALRLVVLAPVVMRGRQTRRNLARVWREHRRAVLVVAILSPLAYLLVLVAFTIAPVSYVAPIRELSIVVGTALGARLLGEERGWARISVAVGVLVGVVLLVTG
jgi:drug/metabolite transporter (DMT)-like permease